MKKYALFCLLLLAIALVGCGGGKKVAKSGSASKKLDGAGSNDMFNFTIDSLNRLEQFQTERVQGEIQQQIQELVQAANSSARPASTLLASWPESESMRQIVDHLNQWIRVQPPPEWRRDPLIAELPEPLRKLPIVAGLEKMEIGPFDGYYLQEAVYMRDVSLSARGKSIDDRLRASRLFDWTIRNIQLEEDSAERTPQFPWETLFFGHGTAWERAWVFVLLARQEGLEAAVLAIDQKGDKPSDEKGEKKADEAKSQELQPAVEFRPWCVAVLIEGKAYLFDTAWGLPIPGPGGVKKGEFGELDLAVASLDQLLADESILVRMNADAEHPYPVRQADLKNMVALVEGSPSSLSRRMNVIESHLQGKQKMVLTASASQQAEQWKKLPGITGARLWQLPYETIRRRSQLKPQEIAKLLARFLPFYAIPVGLLYNEDIMKEASKTPRELQDIYRGSAAEEDSKNRRMATDSMQDTEAAKTKRIFAKMSSINAANTAPLYKGRVLQLKGQISGEDNANAMHYYKLSRPSQEQVALIQEKLFGDVVRSALAEEKGLSDEDREKLVHDITEAAFGGKPLTDETIQRLAAGIQKIAVPLIQQQTALILMGKMNASYWLGLISYERGNYPSAYDYLGKRTLEAWPNSSWTEGANYNVARTFETGGEIDQSVKVYRANAQAHAPDAAGQWLRAKWLEDVQEKRAEKKAEEGKTEEAKAADPNKEAEKAVEEKKTEETKIEEGKTEKAKPEEPKSEAKPVEEKSAEAGKVEEEKSGEKKTAN